jgi:hypothetical protein
MTRLSRVSRWFVRHEPLRALLIFIDTRFVRRQLGFTTRQMGIAVLTFCIAATLCSAVHGQSSSDFAPGLSVYAVGGLALGDRVPPLPDDYNCSDSEQFDKLTWCTQKRVDYANQGSVTTVNSILHRQDGTVVYVNRAVFPAYFERNEFDRVVEHLSKRYGQTAEIIRTTKRGEIPDAIIAFWGAVKLVPLDGRSLSILRSGGQVTEGILVDLLGDYERSAKQALPIYRLSGGAGYVWAASRSGEGRGHVRFFAINGARFSDAMASVPPERSPPPRTTPPRDTPEACRKFPLLCD